MFTDMLVLWELALESEQEDVLFSDKDKTVDDPEASSATEPTNSQIVSPINHFKLFVLVFFAISPHSEWGTSCGVPQGSILGTVLLYLLISFQYCY